MLIRWTRRKVGLRGTLAVSALAVYCATAPFGFAQEYQSNRDPYATQESTAQDGNAQNDSGTSGSGRGNNQTTRANGAAGDGRDASLSASTNDNSYGPDYVGVTRNSAEEDDSGATGQSRYTRDGQRTRDGTLIRPLRRPAAPSEFERFVSKIADKQIQRFGEALLVPGARDFTVAPTTTVPTDYRINPGDELIIGLSGAVQSNSLSLRVNSQGRIFIPQVGEVAVGGVAYGDVPALISRQVGRLYRNFRVSVTAGRLHGITVYVTGFAQVPGSYTVSSLSTLTNAVLAAGGPSQGGSFRSIQLRRNGALIADFDLYDLLLRGDKSGDAVLQNGDVLFIAPAGPQVAVFGSVNGEAVYEAKPSDTLADILRYAGGTSTVADQSRLMVLDPLESENGWHALPAQELQATVAKRAQIVRVLSNIGLVRPIATQPVLVTVDGEVAHPGRYYLAPGASIDQAIRDAGGLTSEAFVFGSVLTRESLRQQQQAAFDRARRDTAYLLAVEPLTSALSSENNQIARVQALREAVTQLEQRRPEGRLVLDVTPQSATLPSNLVLENNDRIFVPARPVTVSVFGAVPSPSSFRFTDAATIGDYIKQAGGIQKIGDKSQIFVVRANGTLLAPKRGTYRGPILKARALPGDVIFVPVNPSRNAFWAKLRDLSQTLFAGAVASAAVVSATN